MAGHFTLRHLPPLCVAAATTFGGLIPFFNAEYAIQAFGLPASIAISQPAQSIMILCSGRTTALGLALFLFYARGRLIEFDQLLMVLGYVGAVDGYVCWCEGVPGKAIFRALSGMMIAGWGWFGMTSR